MQLTMTMAALGLAVLSAAWLAGCGAPAGGSGTALAPKEQPGGPITVVWQEGEDFAESSRAKMPGAVREGRDGIIGLKPPASGGKALGGPAVEYKDSLVRYELTLPSAIADAQLIFRYARYNWRHLQPDVPAKFQITVKASGATAERVAEFKDTDGWGMKSAYFLWLPVKVGDLPAGRVEVTLLSLKNDNSIIVDGFLVAPAKFQMDEHEAGDLARVAITGQGYCGLLNTSTVYVEKAPGVFAAARSFDGREASVEWWAAEESARIAARFLCANEANGRRVCARFLTIGKDGPCALTIRAEAPSIELKVPILLAGDLAADVPAHVSALRKKVAESAKSTNEQLARCAPDFQQAIDFLTAGLKDLPTDEEPQVLADNLKRTMEQGEETLRRLQAGEDPYAGRTGQLRRGFISAATGELVPYRMMIPTAYLAQAKVPLVLMLGGRGSSENAMFDHDGGLIPRMLEERGFVQITPPTYIRDQALNVKDYLQLIDLVLKEYPKIDRGCVYATGVSSGGFHSFALAVARPELFAGIGCVSGTTRTPEAPEVANLKRVPTLIIHGGADTVIPKSVAENTAARLKELGATYEMKIFPTYGHDYRTADYLSLTLDWWAAHPKR